MKILLSPAKRLDLFNTLPTHYTKPNFTSEAHILLKILKALTLSELKKVLEVSNSIAEKNYQIYQNWPKDEETKKLQSAIFLFKGDAYKTLQVKNLPPDDLEWLQENLFILSGLYGILKPLDLISPYRLQIGSFLKNSEGEKLYDFWGDKLHKFLEEKLEKDELILNLSSKEYAKAVQPKKFENKFVEVEFKEIQTDGKLKTIVLYTKQARGAMVRFCAINRCQNLEDVKRFNLLGYKFSLELSQANNLVFVR